MLYPDPKQRKVFGWTIRWVASLFAALMVVTGSVPVSASPSADRAIAEQEAASESSLGAGEDAASHAVPSSPISACAGPETLASADVAAPVFAYLGGASLSEVEIVEEPSEPTPLAATPIVFSLHDTRLAAEIAARAPTSVDAAGRLCTRAPPLA